ncbi:MAG TPA: RNB domain-containing ribonuclease [Solirubrobacteraceae bacterium]|nr:RNB domain-containing ribonuclease [Solirubrobacteraceae bacterium]
MTDPSPAPGIVAVLDKRGRFWTAEPLFGMPQEIGDGPPWRRTRRLTLGAHLSGEGAGRARVGDLVLVGVAHPGHRGPPGQGGQSERDAPYGHAGSSARGGGRHSERRGGRGGPRGATGGQAEVLRLIGRPDIARDVLEGLMLHNGLARRFDADVEREARGAARLEHSLEQGAGPPRRDLRELVTFTIDPATARDFDDAISAERLPDGGARIWVHIADVAAHVQPGSALDREARMRATSVYVPGAVEPMLPHALSSDACSLQPGRDRAAVTVELDLDGARVRRVAFHRSLIRSDERLDYDRVDRIFAGRERAPEPWGESLEVAREVARALGEARARRAGALTLESTEPEFRFDDRGNVVEVSSAAVQSESHHLIEHLMIAANEAVAETLERHAAPCLYRVHERPQPERVRALVDQLASLGVATPPVPDELTGTRAAQLVGEVSRLLEAHLRRAERRGEGGRRALTSLVLRALQQAHYSPRNVGHAGLGSQCYCHFTSPIRRYPDIVCHRALLAVIGAGEGAPRAADLAELGQWTSERERGAMEVERDADDVACCFALERELYRREAGPGAQREYGAERVFGGEVVGLIGAGAFVAFGTDGRYEGMLPVRRIARAASREQGREWWELNEQGTILRGERSGATLRLGDPIAVRVARVDAPHGRVDLAPGEPED